MRRQFQSIRTKLKLKVWELARLGTLQCTITLLWVPCHHCAKLQKAAYFYYIKHFILWSLIIIFFSLPISLSLSLTRQSRLYLNIKNISSAVAAVYTSKLAPFPHPRHIFVFAISGLDGVWCLCRLRPKNLRFLYTTISNVKRNLHFSVSFRTKSHTFRNKM